MRAPNACPESARPHPGLHVRSAPRECAPILPPPVSVLTQRPVTTHDRRNSMHHICCSCVSPLSGGVSATLDCPCLTTRFSRRHAEFCPSRGGHQALGKSVLECVPRSVRAGRISRRCSSRDRCIISGRAACRLALRSRSAAAFRRHSTCDPAACRRQPPPVCEKALSISHRCLALGLPVGYRLVCRIKLPVGEWPAPVSVPPTLESTTWEPATGESGG